MKKWLKIVLILLGIAALSVGIYFTLKALGITSIEGLREIIEKCGAWGWIVFIVLFTLCSILLCFIPGTSATFIAVAIILFGALKGFVISIISVFLASSIMFVVGNTLGEKAVAKIVGTDSLHKAQDLLDVKSKMLLPLMFLFPVFPDDALCCVAGMTKMKYWYFAIIVAIFRTIGIATICFLGSGFINWAELKLTDWFVLINICVFDIFLIFKYQNKIEKLILRKNKQEEKAEEVAPESKPEIDTNEQIIINTDKAIARYKNSIEKKQYASQEQLNNIKKKIVRAEAHRNRLSKLVKEKEELNNRQNEVCERIEMIMKNQFPKTQYNLKRSLTTTSVYLSFVNDNNVQKTIRFSDHPTSKGVKQYPADVVASNKAMIRIIESNIKVLNQKTVLVLLDRLKEEKDGV